ncbi:MAG: hypothetical protein MUE51_10495 [Thermoleophilia bacterium]|jgi:hypothetical protein|nr:hypothetical protein [Thermoleophilia bacterium]
MSGLAPLRVLVVANGRPPELALDLAAALAGERGEVVLAAMLVMPLTQPFRANVDEPVATAVALLEAGEGRVTGQACACDTRLCRCRSVSAGLQALVGQERFDVVIAEGAREQARGGLARLLGGPLGRSSPTTLIVRAGQALPAPGRRVVVVGRDPGMPDAALPIAVRLTGRGGEVVSCAVQVVPVTEALPGAPAEQVVAVAEEGRSRAAALGATAQARPLVGRSFARALLDHLAREPADLVLVDHRRDEVRMGPEGQLAQLWDRAGSPLVVVRGAAPADQGASRSSNR